MLFRSDRGNLRWLIFTLFRGQLSRLINSDCFAKMRLAMTKTFSVVNI